MPRFAINGRFVVRKQTGQERFAKELISELDKIVKKDEFVLVVPEYAKDVPNYKNISIVRYGKVKSHFWEQVSFYRYIRKHSLLSINLTTTCPLLAPGIVCLHDACLYEIHNLLTQNIYGRLSTAWHKIIFFFASKRAKRIITVSNYSKQKLMKYLHLPETKISVVYNAWQHFERISSDESIFGNLPNAVEKGNYFLALSSLTPQKNFVWIKRVALRNPNKKFVICGSAEGFTKLGENELKTPNMIFTGYITDSQIKALMTHCRAFIHPAIYEGFGIPPLEAMSCGAKLILSTATCLPEIYGNSAHYVDPYRYDYDLESLLQEPIAPPNEVLNKYNWSTEAAKLYQVISDTCKGMKNN